MYQKQSNWKNEPYKITYSEYILIYLCQNYIPLLEEAFSNASILLDYVPEF
ncbi:hypothetical protein J6TS2_11700 [Heyndrickxia sporothermodurans]|nr:hypothetical protein J6TS2_11700 [Heyndrickxia sporothermodurans]